MTNWARLPARAGSLGWLIPATPTTSALLANVSADRQRLDATALPKQDQGRQPDT